MIMMAARYLVMIFLAYCMHANAKHIKFPALNVNLNRQYDANQKYDENSVFKMHQDQTAMAPKCGMASDNDKFDCHPDKNATQTSCESRGCCWKATKQNRGSLKISAPSCYFPKNYPTYKVSSVTNTKKGKTVKLSRTGKSPWPNDVQQLNLDISMETPTRLHFKIYDPAHSRYEVPLPTPVVAKKVKTRDYELKIKRKPFGITVTRKETGAIIFDTVSVRAPLIFADQFLQISTHTGTGLLYGLGEHQAPLLRNSSWSRVSFWDRDQAPEVGDNLYGDHPFFLSFEKDGKAHGVFLLNSNAMDVDIQPLPALTYRTIGGVLDFYLFIGPSPDDVIQQYTEVIGRPFMPPYWSLGFHLCRWGYGTSDNLKKVIDRNRAISIPYEVQWTDIDYMRDHLDWTYDTKAFKGLPEIVKDLHDNDQKYIIIVDPAISSTQPAGSYAPFDEGLTKKVFVTNETGQPLIGKVWPGPTAFPDFFNPATQDWWYDQAAAFHKILPFDGLWTDMNEPSNFVAGSVYGCPKNSTLNYPPYVPGIVGDTLFANTLCPSAMHKYLSQSHYNLHSMYGHSEVNATMRALNRILGKRSIVISRSSFPGTGTHGGHWSGDIHSNWDDIYYSIPQMLNFQMYGIPFVGADICGFGGDTTEELCTRWMQLAAFYPFMRNHNSFGNKDQDPAVFSAEAQKNMKAALNVRYGLMSYLYTLLFESHESGHPVVRPLSFQYPTDPATYVIDRQFMWGDKLMVVPVLEKGAKSVQSYFPKDVWYNYLDHKPESNSGSWASLPVQMDTMLIFVRGGSILPTQDPALRTSQVKSGMFCMVCGLDAEGKASGGLFMDDGESLDTVKTGQDTGIRFMVINGTFSNEIVKSGYRPASGLYIKELQVMGVGKKPGQVTVAGKVVSFFTYDNNSKYLIVTGLKVDMLQPISIKWS